GPANHEARNRRKKQQRSERRAKEDQALAASHRERSAYRTGKPLRPLEPARSSTGRPSRGRGLAAGGSTSPPQVRAPGHRDRSEPIRRSTCTSSLPQRVPLRNRGTFSPKAPSSRNDKAQQRRPRCETANSEQPASRPPTAAAPGAAWLPVEPNVVDDDR